MRLLIMADYCKEEVLLFGGKIKHD